MALNKKFDIFKKLVLTEHPNPGFILEELDGKVTKSAEQIVDSNEALMLD